MAELAKVRSGTQMPVPEEIRRRYDIKPGDTVLFRPKDSTTFEVVVLPHMTLEEAIRRFRIEGPIDMKKIREEAEEELASEFLRELDRD